MSHFILQHKKWILILFLACTLASAAAIPLVGINYDMSDYLPEEVPSSLALSQVEESFGDAIPNLNVFVAGVDLPGALSIKEELRLVRGVSSVLWLDDAADIYTPPALLDEEEVSPWLREEGALFLLAGDTRRSVEIVADLKEILGEEVVLSGPLVDQATLRSLSTGEVSQIIFYVIPLVMLVLFLSTSSWFEPLLFLAAIGCAILLNEGTNLLIGEISYVTRSTGAVLQLAVSMDYAVFLLHSFSRYRLAGQEVEEAMKHAMEESMAAVSASALTTVFGFLALAIMKFRLGPNLGLVLAKGILFSFLSVMLFLPILSVYAAGIMERTAHRSFLPSFEGFSRRVMKVRAPLAILVLLLLLPGFLAQRSNTFIYGSSGIHSEDSTLARDAALIEDLFGLNQQMVILVPQGDASAEAALSEDLADMEKMTRVLSFAQTVGNPIPPAFLEEEERDVFMQGGYSRFILYADIEDEGDEAFAFVEAVRQAAEKYYGASYFFVGQSVVNYDLKDTIQADGPLVNGAAMAAIGLVILLTFRSLSIPLILLLTIEGAIWINLGIPYFTGSALNYVGYLIISSVQLGATVDYGILFVSHYRANREKHRRKEAARLSIETTTASIVTPASILAIATLILGFVSTNGIISELGFMLGRGALISAAMVLFFLPALLVALDGWIWTTTLGSSTILTDSEKRQTP